MRTKKQINITLALLLLFISTDGVLRNGQVASCSAVECQYPDGSIPEVPLDSDFLHSHS
jgi:hypothetical protein